MKAFACVALLALLGSALAAPSIDVGQLQALAQSGSGASIGATMAALGPALGALAPAAFAGAAAGKGLPPSAFIPADVLANLRSMGINPDAPSSDSDNDNDDDDDDSDAPSPDLSPAQLQQLLASIFGGKLPFTPSAPASPASNGGSDSASQWLPGNNPFIPKGVIPQGVPFVGRKMLQHGARN